VEIYQSILQVGLNESATYYHVKKSKSRIQVHQGGTRSGKTYSILKVLVEYCWRNKNAGQVITICRKTFPSLRASSMRDFFEIVESQDWYNVAHHNKSEGTYKLFGNLVEFISVDQPQKVRGRKRDVLYINEANEISLEDWRQLILRTKERIIIDFNPSDEFHWIYDQVITRPDADFFQTTYLDNPFLDQNTIDEIERLKDVDENFWRVYGLGERGTSKATIFTHYKEVDQIPEGFKLYNIGLDFGYTNDPTSIVEIYHDGEGYLMNEVVYSTGMSNQEIAKVLRDYNVPVIADSAEPKSIDEIHKYGVNIHPCLKGADSIRSGIQFMKSKPLMITSRSVNGIKELRNYKYHEDKNGKVINKPVDAFNHFIDASRYAITWRQLRPNYGQYAVG
jgi:phage terminase large subunit